MQGKGAEVQLGDVTAFLMLLGQCPVNTHQDPKHVGLTHESEILSNVRRIRTCGEFQFEFQVHHECYPWHGLGGSVVRS